MKRDYDFEELEHKLRIDPRQIEKACRISDLLEDISNVTFLRDRLSLYGGTALAFIHLEKILRLSIDVDFNYRHLDEGDWGAIREQIDDRIKRLLYAQGYRNEDLAIQATYPLGRITVQYENHLGQNDSFKIEIGYMRRIPILPRDSLETFRHIATGEEFPVKTPQPEELYANKWYTLLYRGSSRDLFDVYRISKKSFRQNIFRKCAVIDSLMRVQPRLYEIDVEKLVESISIDTALRNLLLKDISKYDFKLVRQDVKEFSQETIHQLTASEMSVIDGFYDKKKFVPDYMDTEMILNRRITDHPLIRWALKQL